MVSNGRSPISGRIGSIADNDPHSLLAWQLALWKPRLGYRLGFITCENLPFSIRALWRRRGWRGLALGLFCAAMRLRVRRRTDLVWTINDTGLRLFRDAGFAHVAKTPLGYPEQYFFVDPARRSMMRRAAGDRRPGDRLLRPAQSGKGRAPVA